MKRILLFVVLVFGLLVSGAGPTSGVKPVVVYSRVPAHICCTNSALISWYAICLERFCRLQEPWNYGCDIGCTDIDGHALPAVPVVGANMDRPFDRRNNS